MNIVHNENDKTFTYVENGLTCYVRYELYDNTFDIVKTLVPKELGGRGIAKELVKFACDYAKSKDYKIVATCSYVVAFFKRNPEYKGEPSAHYVEGACAI